MFHKQTLKEKQRKNNRKQEIGQTHTKKTKTIHVIILCIQSELRVSSYDTSASVTQLNGANSVNGKTMFFFTLHL